MDWNGFTIHKVTGNERTTIQSSHPKSEGDTHYKNVADCLTGKEELIINGAWSRRPVHIIDLAVRSAQEGRET